MTAGMRVEPTEIPDVKLIKPVKHGDDRGFFVETYHASRYREAGIADVFVQDNRAVSKRAATVRGLHFQLPPFAQSKLIWVTSGRIFDVAVDIRPASASFGRHVAAVLDAETMQQLYIPSGFAHGYCTLDPDTEVIYKVSSPYSRAHEGAIAWDDPALGIVWPVPLGEALLSPVISIIRSSPTLRQV